MSARVKKCLPVLKRIRKLGERAKREYVRKCDKEFVDCVRECAKNVIKGNVPLTDRQKTTLRRKRNDIRALSLKKNFSSKETQNSPERWISHRSSGAGFVDYPLFPHGVTIVC